MPEQKIEKLRWIILVKTIATYVRVDHLVKI